MSNSNQDVINAIEECIRLVSAVQPGYRDYRSQIEAEMQADCVAVLKDYLREVKANGS